MQYFSRRLRWVGSVARVGESRGTYSVVMGKTEERRPLENPGINERIILKRILEKWNRGTDWIDLARGRDEWRALMNAVMSRRFP